MKGEAINHLILGYFKENIKGDKLVPGYTKTYDFQEFFHWSLDIPYGSFSKEEVMERKFKKSNVPSCWR